MSARVFESDEIPLKKNLIDRDRDRGYRDRRFSFADIIRASARSHRHSKKVVRTGNSDIFWIFRIALAYWTRNVQLQTKRRASVRSTDSRQSCARHTAWRGVGRSGGSARRVPDVDADGIVRVVLGVTVRLVHLLDILHVRSLRGVVEEHVERQRLAGAQMCLRFNSGRRGDGFVVRRARGDVDGRRASDDRETRARRGRRGHAPEREGGLAPGERRDAHDRRVRPASWE